jgi:serine protease Do
MSGNRIAAGYLSMLATACACGAHSDGSKIADGTTAAKVSAEVPEARQVGNSFAAVAQRLAPAVVRITVREAMPRRNPSGLRGNPFEGTPFEEFFGDLPELQQAPQTRVGMGSGVVIDDKGNILTNQHVVENARDVRVTFADGKELDAKVMGTDPKTDLAVVHVDGAAVSPARFGNSENMQVGQWVMAIGNPFGLDHSVTVGVLSAKGRYGFAAGKLEDFLQTDASINPGNSGGPLINLDGEVIGINTMIAGIGTGVGFAVSAAIAQPISQQLIAHGRVVRAYVGISMQSLTPELRQALGKAAPEKGALVSEVEKGSPAEKAGLQPGDIVLAIGGKATADSREVQQAVLAHGVGEDVSVSIWRDGKQSEISVHTAELPEGSSVSPNVDRNGGQEQLGLTLQTLTPELAQQLELGPSTRGAVITAVRPDSAAADAGLQTGDVIVSVDRKPVTEAAAAAQSLRAPRSGGHLLRVQRGQRSMFVVIKNPPP